MAVHKRYDFLPDDLLGITNWSMGPLDTQHGAEAFHAVLMDAAAERVRAHLKHRSGPNGSIEEKCWWEDGWTDVIVEEVGEVSRVRNDFRHDKMQRYQAMQQLYTEAIQAAAMFLALAQSVRDEYTGEGADDGDQR